MFNHLLGHERNKNILTSMLKNDHFPNVVLLHGHDGVGKSDFARAIGKAIIGIPEDQVSHPDCLEFFPDTKTNQYSMDELRSIIQKARLSPFSANCKVFLLHQLEAVEERGNTLLKIFEQPPTYTYFIGISSQKEAILPTLLSRMFTLSFPPLSMEEVTFWINKNYDKPNVTQLALFSSGSLSRAKLFCEIDTQTLFSLLEKSFLAIKEKDSFSLYKRIDEMESFMDKQKISLSDLYECIITWLQQYGLPQSHLLIEKTLQLSEQLLEAHKKFIRKKVILEWFFFSIFINLD